MPRFSTSGSTGRPKYFTLSDEQLAARATSRGGAKGAAFAALKSLYCHLQLATTGGWAYQLWAAANNVTFYGPLRGGRLQDAIDLINNTEIDGIVASPAALMAFASAGLRHFQCILASGAGVTPEQSVAIRAGLGDNLFGSYGASEVGSIALATAAQLEAMPGCAGELCPGVEVDFDDGQIKVKTMTMVDSYDNNPAATSAAFRDGWFYPGDLGHWAGDLLVLTGRV